MIFDDENLTIEGIGNEETSFACFELLSDNEKDPTDIYLADHMDDEIITFLKISNGPIRTQGLLFNIPENGLNNPTGLVGRWDSAGNYYIQPMGKSFITFGQEITDEAIIAETKERISTFKRKAYEDKYSQMNRQNMEDWWNDKDSILAREHEEINKFGIFHRFTSLEIIRMRQEDKLPEHSREYTKDYCKKYGISFPPKPQN